MTSLPHVKQPCAQCPFRKDSLKGWLGAERAKIILEQDLFTCHKKRHLQCAGHMLINEENNRFLELANRLKYKLELSGKESVFENREACIAHHDNSQRGGQE